MKPAANPAERQKGGRFWRIWEKIWWLVALGFLAANAWVVHGRGWMTLIRFWAAAFVCLGASVLVYAWYARRRALDSLSWFPVEARILSSGVTEDVQRSLSDEPHSPLAYMTYYFPEVEYEYEFQGRTYSSNHILAVRVNYPEAEAREVAGRYQPGTRVRAWCDPRHPHRAVLEPGLAGHEGKYRIPLFIGTAFLLSGIGAIIALHLWRG